MKSAGSSTYGAWADVGNVWNDLLAYINADDALLPAPPHVGQVTGTSGPDTIASTSANEQVDGGMGTDTVVFHGNKDQYTILVSGGVVTVADSVPSRDGQDTALANGLERAQLLVNFSESPENKANVIGVIESGMVFIL